MRKYLFRAKEVIEGEIIYGLLQKIGEKRSTIIDVETGLSHIVYNDSIGQYTGVNDNEGYMIFEGDTVANINDKNDKGIVTYEGVGFYIKGASEIVDDRFHYKYGRNIIVLEGE